MDGQTSPAPVGAELDEPGQDVGIQFVIRGFVDGRPTAAHWVDGRIEAEPEILSRARVVVGLGEEGVAGVAASLDNGLVPAAVALMRAMSVVSAVDIVIPERGREVRADRWA